MDETSFIPVHSKPKTGRLAKLIIVGVASHTTTTWER